MNDQAQSILRIEGLKHQLNDPVRNEHFTVYVEQKLEFRSRDFIGLLGPSGCGKTTLLTILGLLRAPSNIDSLAQFELFVPATKKNGYEKIDIKSAWKKRKKRTIEKLRRRHMGFALQSGELVSALSVRENIAFPLRLNHWRSVDVDKRVDELLTQFTLNRVKGNNKTDSNDDCTETALAHSNVLADSRINRLSGGEYQRVSLARAIGHYPSVVFVDEPTSALNRELANDALSVMRDLQLNGPNPGITFMITHDEYLAETFCNVIVRMAPKIGEPAGEVVDVVRHQRSDSKEGMLTR